MIEAKIICDSVSPAGKRLTTFELRYPKFIHGEAKTHRVLRVGDEGGHELIQEVGFMNDPAVSRNASSSRAIPVAKLIAEVENPATRAYPVSWPAEQKGMQGGAELDDAVASFPWKSDPEERVTPREAARRLWDMGADNAVTIAKHMVSAGLHKSIVNRVLETYGHIRVVATATEWDNFFGLRLHRDAQPEMRTLAEAMWEARAASVPAGPLIPGKDWHLPYVDGADHEACQQFLMGCDPVPFDLTQALIRVSVARCARVSYASFETGRRSTVEEDLRLYEKLVGKQPLHASPAEHQATPDEPVDRYLAGDDEANVLRIEWAHPEQHGNLVGYRQYRKMLPGEAVAPLPEEHVR